MKLLNVFMLLVLIALCTDILAQTTSNQDKPILVDQANMLLKKAFALSRSNLDSAALLMKQALPLYQEAKEWESYVQTLSGISTNSYYRNDFEQFKSFAQNAVDESYKHLGEDHYRYSEALNNLAIVYQKVGDYKKSIKFYSQSIQLHQKNNFSKLDLATKYQNIAVNYGLFNDFQNALNYRIKALEINLDSLASDDPRMGINYKNIGLAYKELIEYDSSLVYSTKGLDILIKNQSSQNRLVRRNLIMTYQLLAEVWLLKEKPTLANNYIQQAMQLQSGEKAFRIEYSYELLAKKYQAEKEYDKAYETISIANRLAKNNYKNSSYSRVSRLLLITSDILHLQGKTDSALIYSQNALQTLAPNYPFDGAWENPPPIELLAKTNALNVLSTKATYLIELHSTLKDTSLLFAAFNTYSAAIDLIRNRRQETLSKNAKNELASKSLIIYEGAIQTSLKLFELTNNSYYEEQAFLFAENNKSILLLEAINEQFAQGNTQLPDSLLEQEKELRSSLAYYQKSILIEKQKKEDADNDKLKSYENNLFTFQQEHDFLISQLEEEYPNYYNLKYNNAPSEIQIIRNELISGRNALIEYFVGDNNIYIFCLSQNDLQIKTIKTNELDLDEVQKFREFVSTPPLYGISSTALEEFKTLGYKYYDLLLKSVVEQLDKSVDELIIIPDGVLAYIPFDVLLTNSTQSSPSNMPIITDYLIHKYSIGYDYSATLLVKNTQREICSFKSDFIAFAPSFHGKIAMHRSCDGSELSQLKCNQEEVEKIGTILNGQINIGQQASTINFKNLNEDHNIIHLATHACADTENPLLNKVYFSDDNMSILDFNNTRLNTQLVVLSACNTGYGKILKGEGVMSIARGLMVAGSPSTMLSLWSVDDCATSDLMSHYYTNLKAGQSKNKALRNAKLKYIESAPKAMKHPFYWGAFVQFGNIEAIQFSNGASSWIYYSIFGFLFLVGTYFFYLSKKSPLRD